jgi:hypothetical protein
MARTRKLSPLLFAGALLCFAFSFFSVSCGNQEVTRFSGVELLPGTTLHHPKFGPAQNRSIAPQPVAWMVAVCAVSGLALTWVRIRRGTMGGAVAGAVGALALVLLKNQLYAEAARQSDGRLRLRFQPGFWLTAAFLVAGAVLSGLQIRNVKSQKNQQPSG